MSEISYKEAQMNYFLMVPLIFHLCSTEVQHVKTDAKNNYT